jgi:hypothetical protein
MKRTSAAALVLALAALTIGAPLTRGATTIGPVGFGPELTSFTLGADRLTAVIEARDYHIVSQGEGHRIEMAGAGCHALPGEPQLPTLTFLLALPPGARAESVAARAIDSSALPGTYNILPAATVLLPDGSDRSGRVNRDPLRKYAFAEVSVCPFTFHPQSGRLLFHGRMAIDVRFRLPEEGSVAAREAEQLKWDRRGDARAAHLLINYEQMRALYEPHGAPPTGPREDYDYVIITTDGPDDLIASSEFLAWKSSRGHSVRIVLTTDPEIAGQPGDDLTERIRNFLCEYYVPWGIEYVLLVGNNDAVPMRYGFPDPENHSHNPGDPPNYGGSVPTDAYYADLSLPEDEGWDADGDGYPGEFGEDQPDFMPEVYVGRIPTSIIARVSYTLDKLVAFEQDIGSWKDRALHPGSMLFLENQNHQGYPRIDGATLLNAVETDFLQGWTISHYSEQEGLDPSTFPWNPVSIEAFTADWRAGQYGVVNWSGHGSPAGAYRLVWDWDDGDGVPEAAIGELSSPEMITDQASLEDDYPSIVFAISCFVGYPEPNGIGNLGVDLLTKPGFGAAAAMLSSTRPAAISADVIASPGGVESYCYEFNRRISGEPGEQERLGPALLDAKQFCHQNYGWDICYEYQNMYNYNLYGDPAMVRRGSDAGVVGGETVASSAGGLRLLRDSPNPFRQASEISYALPVSGRVKVEIFSPLGRRVTTLVDGLQEAGTHTVRWSARSAGRESVLSGVYYWRVQVGGQTATRSVVLVD